MSAQADAVNPSSQNALQTPQNYPVPLFPPRAMSASSKSSPFSLSRNNVVYEDQWLVVVNKPQGVNCESVLEPVPQLLCDSAELGDVTDVKYEGVYEWKGATYDGHELHAESLSLEHPVTGLPVMFRAPVPSWASQALQH